MRRWDGKRRVVRGRTFGLGSTGDGGRGEYERALLGRMQ